MRKQKKLSLQWRVTLLTAIILTVCSVSITVFSICSAEKMLYPLLTGNAVSTEPIYSENSIENEFAVPSSPAEEQKQLFDMRSIWFCIVMTVLGTGATWLLSGRALEPLKKLSDKVAQIDEHNLSERLPAASTKDEIGKLTISFNHMLTRLEEAFKRQKRFTASAAHELKTPLATVKAGMQVLKRDTNVTIQDYQENAELAIKNIDRLTGVVNDLLLLASAEERKEEAKEAIDLDTMFEAVFSEIVPLYEKQSITYNVKCDAKRVNGNSSMLYRVFYNLIENAYKYNKKYGSIFVKTYATEKSIVIEISDTGIGIPDEHLPLICEPFYRVDASRSRKIAGAGLGLSIVQAIIERHRGTLGVESELGVGTTFKIMLPND